MAIFRGENENEIRWASSAVGYIIIYNKYGMSHLLLYSTTIFLSR